VSSPWSVVLSGYSSFFHDIAEILLKVVLNTKNQSIRCVKNTFSHQFQGNSNSISTVDVSAGYIGLHDYQPVMVGCLLTIATYGGLVFWLLSMLKFIFWKSAQTDDTVNCFSKRYNNMLMLNVLSWTILSVAWCNC
jgi:hypothetical protein